MNEDVWARDLADAPDEIAGLCRGAVIEDRTFGQRERTYFVSKHGGCFLKVSQPGGLKNEALMTEYFNKKGFAPEVLAYVGGQRDFMLTRRAAGENGIDEKHLQQPERLCDVFAQSLRALHEADTCGCPVGGVTGGMLALATQRLDSPLVDPWLLEYAGIESRQAGAGIIESMGGLLREDVHLHGDACLPNIIMRDFAFSAFVDLGGGGMGDRHLDLLWAVWSLGFNLKTEKYRDRFLDAYGRDVFDQGRFALCTAIQAFVY